MDKELLKGNVAGLILAILSEEELHGYAIAREIERRSESALSFKEGTLYPALHALEDKGFIKAQWETVKRGPSRKIYSLTEEGKNELERRRSVWVQFSTAISSIMLPKGGGAADAS
ncbi:hypothetical protein IAD21_01920 [Abditibacteriota bacterium]|nr:hypothetical protein IAD21_01920 [Abditibacteriota bacterium]